MKNNVKLIIIIFFSNRNTNFELIYYYSFVQIFLFKTLIDKCHIFIIKRQLTRPEQELMYAPFSSIVEISPCRAITNNLCDKTGLKSWLPLFFSRSLFPCNIYHIRHLWKFSILFIGETRRAYYRLLPARIVVGLSNFSPAKFGIRE